MARQQNIEQIKAARLRAAYKYPYLSTALWALIPIERSGLGTFAVDAYYRLYYDPKLDLPVDAVAGGLVHEVNHLLRDHHKRAANMGADPVMWNYASDAEINDDLVAEGITPLWPPMTRLNFFAAMLKGDKNFRGTIVPETLGAPDNKLAEEYYRLLEKKMEQGGGGECQNPKGQPQQGQGAGKPSPQSQGGSKEQSKGGGGAPQSSTQNQKAEGGAQSQERSPGDESDSKGSDGGGSTPQPSSPKSGSSQATGEIPAPAGGRCGSAATGCPEPWEEGPPDASQPNSTPGVSEAEGELIKRDTARKIVEMSKKRGTVPGGWLRWAEELLKPKVNWRRELAASIRYANSAADGMVDYSYRKPNRRQATMGNVIMPSLKRPVPSVAVVIDTSGSISDKFLGQSLAEIKGILEASGRRESVHVLSCDAAVHTAKKIFSPKHVELAGGGGTEMGVGVYAAAKLKPKPHLIVVVTDGYTPWPADGPQKVKVIVVLPENENKAPKWAKEVRVKFDAAS